jgi:2-keto-4-pentenoate hydratase
MGGGLPTGLGDKVGGRQMDTTAVAKAAEALVAARRTRLPIGDLPDGAQPDDDAEAYAIQDAVANLLGMPIAGWKVGAQNVTAIPNAAPLLGPLMGPSPCTLDAKGVPVLGIEAELAFRFKKDLPERNIPYARDEVAAAIGALHPAIEVVDSRFHNRNTVTAFARLADFQSNGYFVFRPEIKDWKVVDPTKQAISLDIGGKRVADTVGGNAAVDLFRLLMWLVDHAGKRGRGIKAGDIVTTGSCAGLKFAKPGDTVAAQFTGLGEVRVTF